MFVTNLPFLIFRDRTFASKIWLQNYKLAKQCGSCSEFLLD